MKEYKYMILLFACYCFWGFESLYWSIFPSVDYIFVFFCRILWATFFAIAFLALQGRLKELIAVLKDKEKMKYLVPAAIMLFGNWTTYMYAVSSGHILDTSLAYYMSPLMVFFIGCIVFREKCRWPQLVAIGVVFIGVAFSAVMYGRVPLASLGIAVTWAIFTAIGKKTNTEAVTSMAVECLLFAPLALAALLIFRRGENGLGGLTFPIQLFLIGGGIVSILPTAVYTFCVSKLQLIHLSIFHYISPTFAMVCGLLMGEAFSMDKVISFGFIWAGIIIFTVSTVLQNKRARSG